MAHRNILSVGDGLTSPTNFSYNEMLKDAANYCGFALPDPAPADGHNLSAITGFTITHKQIIIGVNSSVDNIFFVQRVRPPFYPQDLDPLRIIFSVNQQPPNPIAPISWAIQPLSNPDCNLLDNRHYILNHGKYVDMKEYVTNELMETSNGLVAIPCKDYNDRYYFYFGIYKLIPNAQNTGKRIKNQSGREIQIFPGGPGGEGDSAGARIPAP